MADSERNGKGGRTAATAGIIALLLMLGGGSYFGLGLGNGQDTGSGGGTENVQQEAQQETADAADKAESDVAAEAEAADSQKEAMPDVIVVTIKEDKVTINGHEVADQAELKQYVEDYNSDTRTFTLEEEQSILETYNWVKAVFDELDIQLKNSR